MDEIKSIWDGWEKQCFDRLSDDSGAQCAIGYVLGDAMGVGAHGTDEDWWRTYPRVGPALRKRFPELEHYSDPRTIIEANNRRLMTPEDFRRIDRETQLEEITKPLIESAETPSELAEVET